MIKTISPEYNLIYQQEHAAIIEKAFDEHGWSYEKANQYQFKLTFLAPYESKILNTIHLVTAYPDRLFVSTLTGIKVQEENVSEVLKLLNYLNGEQINYGRFIISKNRGVWFDIGVDLLNCDLNEEMCCKAIHVSSVCVEKFCNNIFDVATGVITADDAIAIIELD